MAVVPFTGVSEETPESGGGDGAPVARLVADPPFGVMGTVVRLDGRGSTDPDGLTLAYEWEFLQVPIGSLVRREGFRLLEDGLVSFSPDRVGEYRVQLTVSNGTLQSAPASTEVSIRAILVPHGRGIIPDGKFIWSYLRDVWADIEGKEVFETLWSALIQISGAELLKLYQADFNKSIRDIQEQYQRRWLSYEPELALEEGQLVFGLQAAGTDGSTELQAGASGPTTDTLVLDFPSPEAAASVQILPGRVLTVGGRTFTVVRTTLEGSQLLVTLSGRMPSGLGGLSWRVPHTLVSETQDFEALGVCPGDLMQVEVTLRGSPTSVQVPVQVVGASGHALGFVLTTGPLQPGVVPEVDPETLLLLSDGLRISTALPGINGEVLLSGVAKELVSFIGGTGFSRLYANRLIAQDAELVALGMRFSLRAVSLRRNRKLPAHDDLRSIPLLQEYIAQPEDGRGAMLSENRDFIIDGPTAFEGELYVNGYEDRVSCSEGDFVDRGIVSGDTFRIISPADLRGDYIIRSVTGNDRLFLSDAVFGAEGGTYVGVLEVEILRRQGGHFLRLVPGLFGPRSPAPKRLWAEVSFFDNSQAIEDNFGILVGLTRDDLASVTKNLNYRQAVTGLMYAYTRGSALDKVRLGAHILLGLPYAEVRGTVRSIEPDYRLDVNGDPIEGRVLIEDLDSPGTMRIYTYPIDSESNLSGLDVNPLTGKTFAVGDVVEPFTALCRGVEVSDYLSKSDALTTVNSLQKYHSIQVRVNDEVFGLKEIGLVSSFLREITPSYLAYFIATAMDVNDEVEVLDDEFNRLVIGSGSTFGDSVGMKVPLSLMFDFRSSEGFYTLYSDGAFFRIMAGADLTVDSAAPFPTLMRPSTGATFPELGIRAGDQVQLFSGEDVGRYPISSVNDYSVAVQGAPSSGFSVPVDPLRYAIIRKADALVTSGNYNVTTAGTTGTTRLIFTSSLPLRDGVAVGDKLLDWSVDRVYDVVTVHADGVTVNANLAVQSAKLFRIYRPQFFSSQAASISVTGNGTNNYTTGESFLFGLLRPRDELLTSTGISYTVLDPISRYITPALPVGTYTMTRVYRNRGEEPVDFGTYERSIEDEVSVGLVDPTGVVQTTSGSKQVNLPLARPSTMAGDMLKIQGLTLDVGYGPGVYPIVGAPGSSLIDLSVAMNVTTTANYRIIRRR